MDCRHHGTSNPLLTAPQGTSCYETVSVQAAWESGLWDLPFFHLMAFASATLVSLCLSSEENPYLTGLL